MSKCYILVEGHGEVEAAANLVSRMASAAGLSMVWGRPIRWRDLHRETGLRRAAELIRAKPDAGALLVLRDEDDECPRDRGPVFADWLRALRLPFPAAIVLLHPEYEVLFLPCLDRMAGRTLGTGKAERPGLAAGTRWDHGWEDRRGIKEWLSHHYPEGRIYKPTTDQLDLTRMIDLDALRAAGVPCFGTLERALGFLAAHLGEAEVVYP